MGMLLKILVVDDDRLSRRIMEKNLASQGYKVITAEDGEKALEILTEDADISLVITDWNMPRMDGVELCRAARALKRSRYLPLILLTARGEKQDLIEGLNAGADAFISKPLNFAELQAHLKVSERIIDLEAKLEAKLHQLKEAHDRIEEIAHQDVLTKLANRRFIMELLDGEIARCKRYSTPLSAFILDIDHFKQVNDTYGHLSGDAVLRQLGTILSSAVRSSDHVGRYGGEEFLGFLPETDCQGAMVQAERIRKQVEDFIFEIEGNQKLKVTISIGVTSFIADKDTAETFLSRADEALYKAKQAGRNRVACQEVS
jgi:two-component system chemotaxis response regulator CheY